LGVLGQRFVGLPLLSAELNILREGCELFLSFAVGEQGFEAWYKTVMDFVLELVDLRFGVADRAGSFL
jgi:hypothetical protein